MLYFRLRTDEKDHGPLALHASNYMNFIHTTKSVKYYKCPILGIPLRPIEKRILARKQGENGSS